MWSRLALLVVSAGAALGCVPSLGTFEPARTVPAGHLQVTTSVDYSDTSGPIREAIDGARALANTTGPLTREELGIAADATGAALVHAPSVGYQVSVAYGLSRRFEVGARSSMSAVRGWGRWQFLRVSPGFYGALGLGVSGYLYGFPVQRFVQEIRVDGFTRWDVDIPLQLGFSSQVFHIWGGPKLVLSSYDADIGVCMAARGEACSSQAEVTLSGTAAYVAAQLGAAIGYRQWWIAAELTVARVGTSGELAMSHGRTSDSQPFDHDGLVIAPAVGLMVWF